MKRFTKAIFQYEGWRFQLVLSRSTYSIQPSITCPQCSMTSYHPEDIRQRFCGNCGQFHDDMLYGRPLAEVADIVRRTPVAGTVQPYTVEDEQRFRRGLRWGCLLSIPLWVLILWLIFG